jgi:hypothetical protein
MNALEQLIAISSQPLGHSWNEADESAVKQFGKRGKELLALLRRKNGFFSFESSLHLLPLGATSEGLNIAYWNADDTWKSEYGDLLPVPALFFALDAFGNNFCIIDNEIAVFYSESAEVEPVANSIEQWADALIADWKGWSGYELSHEWQIANEPLKLGERLIPKIPFVLGGKYEVANLYNGDICAAMRFRGSIARQISGMPDGTNITLRVQGPTDD